MYMRQCVDVGKRIVKYDGFDVIGRDLWNINAKFKPNLEILLLNNLFAWEIENMVQTIVENSTSTSFSR